MLSDFGEAPLSSTRRSSFFNLSNINGRAGSRGIPYNKLFDMDTKRHHNQDWNDPFSNWVSECPSILSSTRMSAVGPAVAMPILKEDDLFMTDDVSPSKANKDVATTEHSISLSKRDTLPAFRSRRASRKSVSFRDVDEYFPVFSPESPKQQPAANGSQCTNNLPFDLSEYFDFLDSERMATVLQKQGIDVTSPDHVYIFCRESSTSTEEDMEKTVISHCALDESDDEQEGENVKEAQVNISKEPARSCGGTSSSETVSSHYSSCESDHYTSALEASTHPKPVLLPATNKVSVGAESAKNSQISQDYDSRFSREVENLPPLRTESQINSKSETTEFLPSMLDKLALCEGNDDFDVCSGPDLDTKSEECVDKLVSDTRGDDRVNAFKENIDLPFTPSPFVTGRTQSRLSRCSLRTSRTPENLLFASSLFEETLPTPVRSRRQTPRSQSSEDHYNSPHAPYYTPSSSENSTGGGLFTGDYLNTQSSTLRAGSSVSNSQADTLILSKSLSDTTTGSQTISDTVILEKTYNDSVDAYERNLAEIILAMQGQDEGHAEGRDFLTDDLTSTDDASEKGNVDDAPGVCIGDGLKNKVSWISENCSSQPDSVSSSSSTSFSPRSSREDSDLPCTPGTGCTPRYSMSRLSSCHRPQHLANLSYTPGGRPLIQDLDEPVEYLYTDIEQGHKLIETHVPPTANTSLSSTMSATSSEETILYDWHSMHTDMMSKRGKENQKPQIPLQKDKNDEDADSVVPEIKGMTDKELRLRLIELGENPGPINSRTRATYMRRLCRRLQESDAHKSPHHHKHLDQAQTGNAYASFKVYDYYLHNLGYN